LSVEAVAKRLLMPKSTLASWVTASRAGKLIDIGKAQRPLTEFELELAKVKRELTEVKMERDLLKKRQRTLSRKYGEVRDDGAIARRLSGAVEVPHISLPPKRILRLAGASTCKARSGKCTTGIRNTSRPSAHSRDLWCQRLQEDLADNGANATAHCVKRIRRKLDVRCKQNRKFRNTTDASHSLAVAPNLLGQKFTAIAPNQIWVTDITYIPTGEGWLYLAGHKDLFSGDLVGYAMSERITKNLVCQSLFCGVAEKRPQRGLIHHSGRGSQYCALEYRQLLDQFGMVASMSRRGNCYDNAPMESFYGGLLKNELIHHRRCKTRAEAIQAISRYFTNDNTYRLGWAIYRPLHLMPVLRKKTDSMFPFVSIIDIRPQYDF